MSAHALLSASGSERWMTCPASVRRTMDLPEERSPAAEEGTRAHDLAEQIFLGNTTLDDHPEFAQLQVYIDYVNELSGDKMIEERLEYTDWVPNGFGTSDVVCIDEDNRTIEVVDLKWGKGIKVSAQGNTQMRLYALGALQRYMFEYELDTVNMTIVQPRLDHIETDTISVNELLSWGEFFVKPAANIALSDNAPANPSPKACQWCKVKNRCRERALAALSIETAETELLTFDEMSALIPLAADLEKWAKEFQAYVLELATNGQSFHGYKLVEGRSQRRWTDNASEVLASAVDDPDSIYERKLLGITALEKLVGKDVVDQCTTKPAGKPALVPSTDKRPAIVAQNVEFPTGE